MDLKLHNEVVAEFKSQYYNKVLDKEHLIPEEITINKIKLRDGSTNDEYNFWGFKLERDGVKYLLPVIDEDSKTPLQDVYDLLPIKPVVDNLEKISSGGQVYYLMSDEGYVTVRPRGVKSRSYKEFINSIADGIPCTNPEHRKLFLMMCMSQLMSRSYYRVATNPGFGKDSTVDLLGELFGNALTIEAPTRAKLEFLILYTNLLAINETVNYTAGEWDLVEKFVQQAAAHKMKITKHSKKSSGTEEILDAKHFSLSLFYNDLPEYSRDKQKKYIDFRAGGQTLDRLPAFRLHNKFQADFNELSKIRSVEDYVVEHFDELRQWIYDFTYYKDNRKKELKRWNASNLRELNPREKRTVGNLLQQLDMYCESQEEFDEWILVINKAMKDYEDMLLYPASVREFANRLGIARTYHEKYTKVEDVIQYFYIKDPHLKDYSIRSKVEYCEKVLDEPTFTGRLLLMQYYTDKPQQIKDLSGWE